MNNLIEIKDITKKYKFGDSMIYALDGVSLNIKESEIVVILGPSGSGKTTMLNCISGLDKVSSGSIYYEGKNISKYSDYKMTKFRKDNLGFIFQTYNLLEHLNVYENVLVGAKLGHNKKGIDDILTILGLDKLRKKHIYEISGGEQQRISIARALAKKPKVMFCDEPTGALDEETGKKVLEALIEINEKYKTTMIIVTHNPGIALIGDIVVKMNSGKIIDVKNNKKRVNPKDIPWG